KSPSSAGSRPRKARPPSHAFRPVRSAVRGNTALAVQAATAYELEAEPEPELIENVIPIGQRCSILELNEDKCHWPIGDPGQVDFFFCGGKSVAGMPYCTFHARVAYQPAADRRNRRAART